MGADSIIDPSGAGLRIWFRADEAAKVVKNRLHIDPEGNEFDIN